MSKKAYVNIKLGQVDLETSEGGRSILRVKGFNKSGTQVEANIILEDWWFPDIIKGMAK